MGLNNQQYKIFLLSFLYCGSLICAATQQAHDGTYNVPIKMQTYKSYFREHCLFLNKGQLLHYTFKSINSVLFNIHHHRNTDTLYLDNIKDKSTASNVHEIQETGEYCFMWENNLPHELAYTIDFQYTLQSSSLQNN